MLCLTAWNAARSLNRGVVQRAWAWLTFSNCSKQIWCGYILGHLLCGYLVTLKWRFLLVLYWPEQYKCAIGQLCKRVGNYTPFASYCSCVCNTSAPFAASDVWQAFASYLFVNTEIEESKSSTVLNCWWILHLFHSLFPYSPWKRCETFTVALL